MRTQAIEKLLRLMVENKDNKEVLDNLSAKALIVLDRNDNRDASVIRELINS